MLESVQGGSNFPGSKCHLEGGAGKGLSLYIHPSNLALVLPFSSSVLPLLTHILVISYFLFKENVSSFPSELQKQPFNESQ